MKTVYLGSEPTDPEWLLIGQFAIPNGGSAFVYRRAGSTTDDCLIVPADMTFDEAADDAELMVPYILMQQSPSFTPVSEMPQMSLVELFEEDTAAKQAATVKMVGRRDRTPDMPGKSTYLTRRNVWNDPGSGRFIRRGFSTLKYLLSLSSDEHRMWEKAKRLDEQNSNGVVAYLKRRAGRADIGPEDALRIVEVFDGDTRFSGNVRVRDDRSGREYIVPWGDLRDVAPAPAVRPQRDWDRYPLGGRSIDALAVPAVEETAVPVSPVKLTTKINTLMPDLSPEQAVQFAALMTDLTGMTQNPRDRYLPMNLRSFVQGYSTREWLDPVFTDENPDPNAVALLQAWRKTLIDHVTEKGGNGVTLHRGVVNRDTNPFVPLRTEHWSNQFNDVRPQSPDAEIAGITSWTSVKTQAKEFGSYAVTQDIPLSQVLGRFGSINGEVLVVDDPLVTRALDAWPNDVDGVPAAPFGTFPERYRAAQQNRAIDALAVPTRPVVGTDGEWDDEQFSQLASDLFEIDLGGGFYSKVVDVSRGDARGQVTGQIFDGDGRKVGDFSRDMDPNTGVVKNRSLRFLNRYDQGQGVGTRFAAMSATNAEAAGFNTIRLEAFSNRYNNGAYVWARAGYDWADGKESATDVIAGLQAVVDYPRYIDRYGWRGVSDDDRNLAREMLARFESDDLPTPNDVAMMGWEPGSDDWFGRRFLMASSGRLPRDDEDVSWAGKLTLSPPIRENRAIDLMAVPEMPRVGDPDGNWTQESYRDLAKQVFNADLGDGFRSVTFSSSTRWQDVSGRILDSQNRTVGEWQRVVNPRSANIENVRIYVNSDFRGRGIGSRFVAATAENAGNLGFANMVVGAVSEPPSLSGGYAWARAGFDWVDTGGIKQGLREVANGKVPYSDRSLDVTSDEQALAQEMLDRLSGDPQGPNFPTPNDVAMLGWKPGAKDWFGRRFMLGKITGAIQWTGILRLQRSDPDARSIDLLSTAVAPEATELNREGGISVAESWVSASRDSWLSPGVPQVDWNGDDVSIQLPTGQTITSRIRKRVAQNDFTGRRQFVGSKWITLDYSNGNGDPLYFDDKAAAKRWAENHLAERFVEADERLRREAILDRVTTEALAQAPADAKVFARIPKSSTIGGYPTPEPLTVPDGAMYAEGDNTGFRDEFDAYINSDAPRDRVQRITEASHAALREAGYTHVLVYRAAYAKDDPYRGVLRHEPLAYTSWSTDRDVAADYVDPGYFRARSQTPLPEDAEPRFFAAVVPIDQIVSFDLIGYRSASLGWGYDGLMDRMIRETAPNVRELNGGEVLVASSVDTADRLLVGDVRQRIDVEERSIDLMALPEPPAQPERRVVRKAPQTNEPISLYEVGGAVRDDIMGINSDDVDFAVTAPSYDAMKKYLEDQGFRIFQEREEFVTIKAQPPEGHPLRERTNSADFVLARRDGPSSDGRRPDYTEPGSLEDDLERRDFTVNAIARDVDGTLIDPHDGISDIETRTLRFVGDPKTRVREDGLRVLRGYRFLVTKGLTPDPATWEALTSPESAEMLKSVSKERVAAELTKMFSFDTVGAIQLLGSLPQATLDAIFPEGVHLAPSMKKVKGQTKDRQIDALLADTVNVAEAFVTDDGRTISWQTLIREMRGVTEVVDPDDSGDVVPFAVPEPTRPVVRVPLSESKGTKVGRAVAERVFGYNATDEDGIRLTASIDLAVNTFDGYQVDGSMQADGEEIGVFSRTLHRDGSVTFEAIRLDEDARGSGWGSRVVASSLDALQREGFNRVYTTAISEPDPSWNGAYTWARTGYDWADPESAMLIGDEITAYIAETRRMARPGLSPESEARFRELAAVLSAGWTGDLPPEDFPTPNDVAMVGWTPELATRIWPGKDLLSNRSIAWDGVLRLQPPETTGSDRAIDLLRASPLDGMRLATVEDRQRLAIPPAYTDVYVSTDPNAKMVWRGVDSQGRMQRGYSAEHHENQAALKFERMKALTERIDTLDAALVRDADTDDRAAALALIRHFGMRPGSRKDTQARKQAFGATTLQARHVRQYPDTGRTTLSFVGKSGVKVTVSTRDPDIYRLIESRLAGKSGTDSLFQTTDAQLLEYLAETIGPGFLTKDFRTLKANVMALEMVSRMRRPTTMTAYRKARNKVADAVAKQLGNTRATTLKSYINPTVFGPWEDALQ